MSRWRNLLQFVYWRIGAAGMHLRARGHFLSCWLIGGIRFWWEGRQAPYLIQGLPAMCCLISVIVIGVRALTNSQEDLIAWYKQLGYQSVQAKDFDTARICCDRLLLLDDRPQYRYWLAICAEAQGQHERSAAIMAKLAPADHLGYPPAHYQLALAMLAQPTRAPKNWPVIEDHLLKAAQGPENLVDAHILLGQLCAQTDRLAQAEQHFEAVVNTRPDVGLMLAAIAKKLDKKETLKNWATRSEKLFRERVEADPKDHLARLNWGESLALLERFPEAASVLQQGLTYSDADEYRARLGEVYYAWAQSLPAKTEADLGKRLTLLEAGLKINPASMNLLQAVTNAARVEGPQADQARELLESLLAQGKAPSTIHVFLGIDACQHGKMARARQHWEQAIKLNATIPAVMNNLAWSLAHTEPTDLPRALELIDQVIKRAPNDPNFRETRGQIYAKMGKWNEALADLEAVLAVLPKQDAVHETLAEVYEHLGNPQMAAQHKKLAKK